MTFLCLLDGANRGSSYGKKKKDTLRRGEGGVGWGVVSSKPRFG